MVRDLQDSDLQDKQGCSCASAPLLRLHDVEVRRAGAPILTVDDFTINESESVALVGPNGAGKTTFVNLVTREVFPLYRDEPPVVFRGNPRMTLADAKRCTGVVSGSMQEQVKVHLCALDVVVGGLFGSLGVPLRKRPSEEQRIQALEALRKLGIADLADRDMLTLSSGQARRVLVARALVHDPDILVFDEPCTGLDPQGMYFLREAMRVFVRAGKAVLLVTHYPEDIVPEIERVVLLKEGRIVGAGAKDELLTSERMSKLFDVPLTVVRHNDWYHLEM